MKRTNSVAMVQTLSYRRSEANGLNLAVLEATAGAPRLSNHLRFTSRTMDDDDDDDDDEL